MTNVTTLKPPTVSHPSNAPPATLDTLQDHIVRLERQMHRMIGAQANLDARAIRVETRLVRLMSAHDLDADGFVT